ncbi:hypothetical protein CR513_31373, partial [Mucuna pruriens]
MAHFAPCHKSDDAYHMTTLFFREVARIHGLPRTIILDRDIKFLGHFWNLGIKILFSTICHPQIDGEIEVVNRTLGQLLICFVGKILRDWKNWIHNVEFSYNMVFNPTISHSPSELTYDFNPLYSLDLFPLPIGLSKAQFVKKLHEKALLHMEKKEEKYVENANKGRKEILFKEGDLVWMHLRKESFLHLRKSKLLPRGDDPFKILKKINNNYYKDDMPQEFGEEALLLIYIRSKFEVKFPSRRGRTYSRTSREMPTRSRQGLSRFGLGRDESDTVSVERRLRLTRFRTDTMESN